MSQKAHFWLSSGAITLTLDAIGAMTDGEARLFLAELRWGSREQQVCPDCGAADKHYSIRTRNQWRCKKCSRTFSVTSGTPFHGNKLPYRKLLLAICTFVVRQKGVSALEMRRTIGAHYRTCFVLLHKLRAVIMLTASPEKLSGVVEIDGAHFSGRKRKPRKKKARRTKDEKTQVPAKYGRPLRARDRADAFQFHPNRRIVMALREVSQEKTAAIDYRSNKLIGKGARRTIVEICMSENGRDCEALVEQYVEKGSLIRTDELPAYGNLKLMGYRHEVVNHSTEFCTDDGINQNQAESCFARLRRSNFGVYHRIVPKYMRAYGWENAWREDVRRRDTRGQVEDLLKRVFSCGILKEWINYCRGNHPEDEQRYRPPVLLAA